VGHQVPDRDVGLVVALEAGDVVRDAIVQPDPAVLHQLHHARRRRYDLGERGRVEDRVERHRLGAGVTARRPIAF
jgi:hypothetical protein